MTLIPDLERDLVQAAARASRRRRRRAALVAACGTVGAVIAAALVLAVSNDSSGRSDSSRPAVPTALCAPGKPPTGAREWRRFDRRPVRSQTVLGCARLDDGRQVELVVRKFRRRGRCFDVNVPARRTALECAVGPLPKAKSPAVAVSAFSPPGTAAARRLGGALVAGWATGDVKRVELHYRPDGSQRRGDVTLISVETVPLVRAAGEHKPFGIFVFKPPKDLRSPRLVVFGANDKRLGVTLLPRALRQPN